MKFSPEVKNSLSAIDSLFNGISLHEPLKNVRTFLTSRVNKFLFGAFIFFSKVHRKRVNLENTWPSWTLDLLNLLSNVNSIKLKILLSLSMKNFSIKILSMKDLKRRIIRDHFLKIRIRTDFVISMRPEISVWMNSIFRIFLELGHFRQRLGFA